MNKFLKFIVLLILLIQVNFSLAWNSAGHQIMAAITWDLLNHELQAYWTGILEHHPRFQKDFKNNIPKYVKNNPKAYAEWVFRQAAIWPDIARGFQQKQKNKYHHGPWHYINYPVYLNEKINTDFLNLKTIWDNKFHNGLNITQAIKGNINILSKTSTSKSEKALALSWVLHLVADSHQPLHSSALFSQTYFPKGDRGGNLTKIKGQGRYQNLHWYWETLL